MMPVKGIQELRPALIAVGFLHLAATTFHFDISLSTYIAIFLAAFTVYSADHLLPGRSKWTWPCILTLASAFVGSAIWSSQFNFAIMLGYILLAIAYVLPLFPQHRRLQDFPRGRVLAVSLGWACMPLVMTSFPFDAESTLYLLGFAGIMLPAILWSDLSDAHEDQQQHRITWSLMLGEHSRKLIILASLIFSLCCFASSTLFYGILSMPLLYLIASPCFHRHPQHSDWFLLWPLFLSLIPSSG
ncbi:hypothetical protein P3T73_09510 [Kiritimatiellota bacterium B12222]|nr:hypothetical protein P3T73_09510 [Kiritimatiellota bacterium B12222]